jgi:hypothetical protein
MNTQCAGGETIQINMHIPTATIRNLTLCHSEHSILRWGKM